VHQERNYNRKVFDFMGMTIIDLSIPIREGEEGPLAAVKILKEVTRAWSGRHFKEPCKGFESRTILMSEHCATHVDAPYHFVPNTRTIDEIPLDHFLGDAVLLDLRHTQKKGQPVRREDLIAVCSKDGLTIEEGIIVLLLSLPGYKGLANDAVDWLIGRGVKAVGTNVDIEEDAVEDGKKVRYAHISFLTKSICIFEGLVNLDTLPSKKFFFIGLPLRIEKGTGSPVRAAAIIRE